MIQINLEQPLACQFYWMAIGAGASASSGAGDDVEKTRKNSLERTKARAGEICPARGPALHQLSSIGLDHFALPRDALSRAAAEGRLRRNFQGYTSDQAETLLGIGATAIGRTPWGYAQNLSETGAWSKAVSQGRLPIAHGHELTREDALRAHVIERIMCDGTVDLTAAGLRFGFSPSWFLAERPALAELAADGLLTIEKGLLSLTEDGAALSRIVAAAFDSYLRPTEARHSVAV